MTNGRPTTDELLSAYHDGELTAADRDAVERLLEESADARSELEDYRALSELFGSLPGKQAPTGLRAAVLRRIEETSPATPMRAVGSGGTRRVKRGLFVLSGLVTAAAGVLLGVNLFDGRFGERANVGNRPLADATVESKESMSPEPGPRTDFHFGEDAAIARSSGGLPNSDADVLSARDSYWHDVVRPPQDALPGDIYRYLEQTDAGHVVVVEATVVDVRQALDQVQVLLSRNSIPTMPVGLDGASGGMSEAAELNGELAVYVESDPLQMNNALLALDAAASDDPGLFLNFQVSGVLDSPPATTKAAAVPPVVRFNSERLHSAPALEPGAGGMGGMGPADPHVRSFGARSRASIPSTASEELAEDAGSSPAAPAPLRQESGRTDEAAIAAKRIGDKPTSAAATQESERKSATQPSNEFGYQQIVQFSKDELKSQLQRQEHPAPVPANAESRLLMQADESLGRRIGAGSSSTVPGNDEHHYYESGDATLGLPEHRGKRRLRLLLVLESGSQKTKADAGAPPVEAPRPRPGKG